MQKQQHWLEAKELFSVEKKKEKKEKKQQRDSENHSSVWNRVLRSHSEQIACIPPVVLVLIDFWNARKKKRRKENRASAINFLLLVDLIYFLLRLITLWKLFLLSHLIEFLFFQVWKLKRVTIFMRCVNMSVSLTLRCYRWEIWNIFASI